MKIEIGVQWKAHSPLHSGSGALADSLADKPLIKDSQGRPLVPGSSVRGKVRHACEQIARSTRADWDLRWKKCDPPYQLCDAEDACPVCRLFGNEGLASAVKFSDLRLTLSALDEAEVLNVAARTDVRWSVGISRRLGTAEPQLLYSVETHRPNEAVAFSGRVAGHVRDRGELGLLVAGFGLVRTLGGGRSRGLGWGEFVLRVSADGAPVELAALIKEGGWTA